MKKGYRRKRVETESKTIHRDIKSSNIIYTDDATSEQWFELLNATKQGTRKQTALFLCHHHHGHVDWNIDLVPTIADNPEPPWFADFLLTMFLKPSYVVAAIGDLREPFDRECESLGRRRATWLYWRRTFNSLRPLLWSAIRKALKWDAMIAAARRLF